MAGKAIKILGGSISLRADPARSPARGSNGELFLDCSNSCNLPFFVTIKTLGSSQTTVASTVLKGGSPPATLTVNGRSGWLPAKNKAAPLNFGEWTPIAKGNSTLTADVEVKDAAGIARSQYPQEDVQVT